MFNEEQEKIRIDKLNKIKASGINPYPYKFEISHTIQSIRGNSGSLIEKKTQVKLAGRITAIRGHGKASFVDIQDEEDKIQLYFKSDVLGDKYKNFDLIDIGDFIGVEGKIFETRTKELTVLANDFVLLSKSLHPLPEKWHGLQDKELRYRKRHLDLIMSPEVKHVFLTRVKIIQEIRNFLDSHGFIEVDTPILQPIYGGGFAEPFKSYYKTLERDFYLRISDELYLKRLIIGGFTKVYEFGKDFRNEGMDRVHNPEFTQLELYQAYADYEDMMRIVEELFETLCVKLKGGNEIEYQGTKIKFSPKWNRMPFFEALKEYVGMDLKNSTESELVKIAEKNGITVDKGYHRGKILNAIFDTLIQPNLIEPVFIIDYPKDISPLAKEKRGDPTLVERFEPFVCGIELGNAFSELNDPLEQIERFKVQQEFRRKGDMEAQVMDEDFIEALGVGMPPTGGLGLGIDRIVMLFTNSYSIKDVILFPQLRT
ncbi:MAG: lysine--tRNA ligase [bacterium]|nr:lysine--tRNA ligase [bacterium]